MARRKTTRHAGEVDGVAFGVTTVPNKTGAHRRRPCEQCPWRSDVPTGVFPPGAFRLSANTAEDMSAYTFACHMAGEDKPQTCAGFLLRGADHNLAVRLAHAKGRDLDAEDGGFPLYDGYVSMSVANGVPADDPALARCRLNWREEAREGRRRPRRRKGGKADD